MSTTVQTRFPQGILGTSWPGWLLLGLVLLGLPRTILADLGIVAPESSWVYFVLALTPFATWFAIAVLRRTATPICDHLLAGALYGLSLIAVHEALRWSGTSLGHQLSNDLASHATTWAIALAIGLGVGAVAAVIAFVANRVRRPVSS